MNDGRAARPAEEPGHAVGEPAVGEPAAAAGAPARAAVRLRLFASAREAAGTGQAAFEAASVGEVLATAAERFGGAFGDVLAVSRVWVNGAPAESSTCLADGDEVAVLPPVSGGATG